MTEFQRIEHKDIYVLMKKYDGGKIEFIGAYWTEEMAKRVAANNITSASPYVTMHTVNLHGSMMDVK